MHGFPQMIKAENYVINHGMADVISQSFGATEETFPNHGEHPRLAERRMEREGPLRHVVTRHRVTPARPTSSATCRTTTAIA